MLYCTVPRRNQPGRWKERTWMQLDLGFHSREQASVWEQLDSQQRAAALQTLIHLMVKVARADLKQEHDNAGHQ